MGHFLPTPQPRQAGSHLSLIYNADAPTQMSEEREPFRAKTEEPPTESKPDVEWRPMMPPELFSPDIGTDGIAVYGVLALHVNGQTGECWPSQNTIAKRLGIGRESVNRAIKRLEMAGLVGIEHRAKEGKPNVYTLPHQRRGVSSQRTPLSSDSTPGVVPQHTGCALGRHELNVIEPDDKEPEGDNPPTPQDSGKPTKPEKPKERPTYPESMLTFWKACHSRSRDRSTLAQVFTEWDKIKPDAETVDEILAGVAAWLESEGWQKGFAEGAHLFLKRRKWEQRPEPAEPSPHVNGFQNGHQNGHTTPAQRTQAAFERVIAKNRSRGEPDDVIETTGGVKR